MRFYGCDSDGCVSVGEIVMGVSMGAIVMGVSLWVR